MSQRVGSPACAATQQESEAQAIVCSTTPLESNERERIDEAEEGSDMTPDELKGFLEAKGASTSCPLCGVEEWQIRDAPQQVGGSPAFVAACGHCGYVLLFDEILLRQHRGRL